MLVYNLTIKVDNTIAGEWLQWQVEQHIPEVMATNLFHQNNFYRLLEQDDTDGPTYVVQYITDSHEKYNAYISKHATLLEQKTLQKWGRNFVVFATLLQTVD